MDFHPEMNTHAQVLHGHITPQLIYMLTQYSQKQLRS